jgi:hypothetical protein
MLRRRIKNQEQVMLREKEYHEDWAIECLLYPRFREKLFELQLQKPGRHIISFLPI